MEFKLSKIFDTKLLYLLISFIALDAVSFLSYQSTWLGWICFFILLVTAITVTAINLEYGVYILLGDLILGGLGYLFFVDVGGFRLPLRLGLFVAIFIVWLIKTILKNDWQFLKDKKFLALMIFGLFWVLAGVMGFFFGRSWSGIFFDANGYLYWGLLGLFLAVKIDLNRCLKVIFSGAYALAIKTILALVVFSYGWAWVGDNVFYKWLRDTRVGEITATSDPLYRIFFQSQIYNLAAFIIVLCILFLADQALLSKKQKIILYFTAWLNLLAVIISGSRSFWVALAVVVVILFGYLIYVKNLRQRFGPLVIFLVGCLVTGQLFINIVLNNYQVNLFFSRVGETGSQASASSRRAQFLPLLSEIKKSSLWGQGFAKTVTYFSSDPRVNGYYTTASFELSYLDMALKFGLFGLVCYLYLVGLIFLDALKVFKSQSQFGFLALIVVTLLVINIFTPYLNHPLGIGLLLLTAGLSSRDVIPAKAGIQVN